MCEYVCVCVVIDEGWDGEVCVCVWLLMRGGVVCASKSVCVWLLMRAGVCVWLLMRAGVGWCVCGY